MVGKSDGKAGLEGYGEVALVKRFALLRFVDESADVDTPCGGGSYVGSREGNKGVKVGIYGYGYKGGVVGYDVGLDGGGAGFGEEAGGAAVGEVEGEIGDGNKYTGWVVVGWEA